MQRDLIPVLLFAMFLLASASAAASTYGSAENPLGDTSLTADSSRTAIVMFTPDRFSIHSHQINDVINGRNGEVIFATTYGLSFFKGSWATWHHDPSIQDKSRDLLDDFILAVEYDHLGRLWIGYAGGIQIWDGKSFTTIEDAQLLKDLQIRDLQRWGDSMWVAAGNVGLHRYQNGCWTWYQPFGLLGENLYGVDSMALDAGTNTLLIAADRKGLWEVKEPYDPVRFIALTDPYSPYYQLTHVKRNPNGGAYFFDESTIAHFRQDEGFRTVLTGPDLAVPTVYIADIAAAPDGKLFVATDRGIFCWYDGRVIRHIDGSSGLGTSSVVETLFIDAAGRLWFSTSEYIGYYLYEGDLQPVITVGSPERTITPGIPAPATPGAPATPATVEPLVTAVATPAPSPQRSPFNDLVRFIESLGKSLFGIFNRSPSGA